MSSTFMTHFKALQHQLHYYKL